MNQRIKSILTSSLAGIATLFSAQAIAVDFTYDAEFSITNGISNVEFPVTLSNAQPQDITAYRIYSIDGATATDVTTLGCGVTSTANIKSSFIASSNGTDASFSAACSGILSGTSARLVISVNQTQPLVMAAGPSVVGVNALTKISWSHNGGYFQCQPFVTNGFNRIWSSGNFGLARQVTSSNHGSTTLVASSSPGSVSFALQCISTGSGFGMPPVAVVEVTVQ
ncbi:MAG: hypothetical protein L3J89_09635 [Gammaproteobacteria bacterium]|nr:hypothetical protein [Gammaproteobacteria bacterium]